MGDLGEAEGRLKKVPAGLEGYFGPEGLKVHMVYSRFNLEIVYFCKGKLMEVRGALEGGLGKATKEFGDRSRDCLAKTGWKAGFGERRDMLSEEFRGSSYKYIW